VLGPGPETGVEDGVIGSTSISSAETVRERLFGALEELSGDNERSREGAETSGRSGSGISGLRTVGAVGVVIVL
jgi:hypothetical protein